MPIQFAEKEGNQIKSQTLQIFEYLKIGNKITPLEALNIFGCLRLGARIWNLRQKGYEIRSKKVCRNGKFVAEYSMGGKDA